MIHAIRELGKTILELENKDKIDLVTEDPGKDQYPTTVVIQLARNCNMIQFEGITVEETSEDYTRYLFRTGSSRGSNFSPTAKLTKPKNTVNQKVLGWFQTVRRKVKDLPYIISAVEDVLKENLDDIIDGITSVVREGRNSYLITLKLDYLYLRDLEEFRDAFIKLIDEKDLSVSAQNKMCALCRQRKETVIGKLSTFKFYTIDKPGFISGGFDSEKAWRNYPVCLECKTSLEEGRRQIENHLRFSFYGLSYLLIPRFLFARFDDPYVDEIWQILLEPNRNIRLKNEDRKVITNDENDILDILAEANDVLTFHLAFIQRVQGAERILLLIDDVLPSRLRRIFEAKEMVDSVFFNMNETGFHFGCIRAFFSKSDDDKRQNDLDKYFLEIVNRIFKGMPLHFNFLLRFIMREVRKSFVREEKDFYLKMKDALATIRFFEELGILEKKGGSFMEGFDELFNKYSHQLDRPEKRGIFLLGALVQMLLDAQYHLRDSQPFVNKLMGLKMDERSLKGLLPKVIDKFRQYERFDKGKQTLASVISDYLLRSGSRWGLSSDELNFYFASGMSLANEVKDVIYDNSKLVKGDEHVRT